MSKEYYLLIDSIAYKNKKIIVDKDIFESVKGKTVYCYLSGAFAKPLIKNYYEKGKNALLSKIILGEYPKTQVVKFKNKNEFDYRRENIFLIDKNRDRELFRAPNGENKYKGVSFSKHKKNFNVKIFHQGLYVYIGSYDDEKYGALLYDAAVRFVRNENSFLNFPGEQIQLPNLEKERILKTISKGK